MGAASAPPVNIALSNTAKRIPIQALFQNNNIINVRLKLINGSPTGRDLHHSLTISERFFFWRGNTDGKSSVKIVAFMFKPNNGFYTSELLNIVLCSPSTQCCFLLNYTALLVFVPLLAAHQIFVCTKEQVLWTGFYSILQMLAHN